MASAKTVFMHNGGVYVGGVQYDDPGYAAPNSRPSAVLWRDGEVHRRVPESGYVTITTVINPSYPMVSSIELGPPVLAEDGRVYAKIESLPRRDWDRWPAGAPESMTRVAGFWKDGEVHYLDIPTDNGVNSCTVSIAVSDRNDVYAIGHTWIRGYDNCRPEHAILWKNGEPICLNDGSRGVVPVSLCVSGEDVFVVGTETRFLPVEANRNGNAAVLWKNGERLHLDLEDSKNSSTASSVFVQDDDVYVLGYVCENPVVWKNGARRALPADGGRYRATSIFVSGEDVYASGSVCVDVRRVNSDGYEFWSEDEFPVIWKNDEKSILPIPPVVGVYLGRAYGVYAQGGDVYAVGCHYLHPALWKNGVMQTLPFAANP
jgi:hypothetical protein